MNLSTKWLAVLIAVLVVIVVSVTVYVTVTADPAPESAAPAKVADDDKPYPTPPVTEDGKRFRRAEVRNSPTRGF